MAGNRRPGVDGNERTTDDQAEPGKWDEYDIPVDSDEDTAATTAGTWREVVEEVDEEGSVSDFFADAALDAENFMKDVIKNREASEQKQNSPELEALAKRGPIADRSSDPNNRMPASRGSVAPPPPDQATGSAQGPVTSARGAASMRASALSVGPPAMLYPQDAQALASQQHFRAETHRLARTRDYRTIAALHESALSHAPWAESEEVRVGLLVDLARLYRDRISDRTRAQRTYERLAEQRPGHEEALAFLQEVYESQGNMDALHKLFAHAVDDEWNPDRRIELTRNAARIALDHLNDAQAAARDWERLLDLGEVDTQVTVELSRVYREAERWSDLGEFLKQRARACATTTRVAILREAVEAFLAGAKSPDRAETLIQEILADAPDDPVALASLAHVHAHRAQWDHLEQIAKQPMPELPGAARLDVLRLVADLLSRAGEHDRAALAHERILQAAPTDKISVQAREEHLLRVGDHEALVTFFVARAERARQADDKAKLLARAATIADEKLEDAARAVSLWLRSVAANPENSRAYEALVSLCDRMNDVAGITQALEGLARVTKAPQERAKVLRRLGEHYAYRADNDNEAQRCWREVLAMEPDDLQVQRELNGIHRRRADFRALDEALSQQLRRAKDLNLSVEIAREIAKNLEENLESPDRSIQAWMHVLDLAQDDPQALTQLSLGFQKHTDTTEELGILEVRLACAIERKDTPEQIALGLEIAEKWEAKGERNAAISAYERVRVWAPDDGRVLDALVRLYGQGDSGSAMAVLEIAGTHAQDLQSAKQILWRASQLVPPDDHQAKFFLHRRLLQLDPREGLERVVEAAGQAGAWRELAAILGRLAEMAETTEERRRYRLMLAELCEQHLNDSPQAYVTIQSLGLTPLSPADCESLARLASSTGRWEDLLAVLDASITTGPDSNRLAVLRHRAEICERHLSDPHRAFLELKRLVESRAGSELNEAENAALSDMHRIAEAHGLHRELLSVYDELWDRTVDKESRLRFVRARQTVFKKHLNDPHGALDQCLLALRLMPEDESLALESLAAAEELDAWKKAIPVIEGVWRATGLNADRLVFLAKLYQEHCEDLGHAIELLAEAHRLDPSQDEQLNLVQVLTEQTQKWPRAVQAIRLATARVSGTDRGLHLGRTLANLYATKLGDETTSLQIHRWILKIWPDELASLETIMDALRKSGQAPELRSSLEQWLAQSNDTSRFVDRWLEIGRLCIDALHDSAGALIAYYKVIELDAENEEAAEAMRRLSGVDLPPVMRRTRTKVELLRASSTRRCELLKELADLELELDDDQASMDALRELYSLEEGRWVAFEPLRDILERKKLFADLASLHEDASTHASRPARTIQHLREALAVAEKHLVDTARRERLLRQLLLHCPTDNEAFFKLTRLLRNGERFSELTQELKTRLTPNDSSHPEAERHWMRRELIRQLDLSLGNLKEAEALLKEDAPADQGPSNPDAALWLAMMAARRQDHSTYIDQRRRHLSKVPKRLGGLILCHLAEHCDQYMKLKGRVLALYREARVLDPDNSHATEGLRGLGRGVRSWRSTAAMLPVPQEETFNNQERGSQLRRLGDTTRTSDPATALAWFERAAAVDPDDYQAWDAIAKLTADRGDLEYAHIASVESMHAYERVTQPSATEVPTYAMILAQTASVARAAGNADDANSLASIAFAVDPEVPPVAVLVADARFEAGQMEAASGLYNRLLSLPPDALEPKHRAHAFHRAGAIALQKKDLDTAYTNLKSALEIEPLMPQALSIMGELLRTQNHPLNSALHRLKALLVTTANDERGRICRSIGELFEQDLGYNDEAGAWFELAVEAGLDDRALMKRLLQHYRRTGRTQQALTALEGLVESTSDPITLAELWATRGSILAEVDLDSAVEALDIALSYNPSDSGALNTLQTVLLQRGDFAQLADLLDARTETGSTVERVEALRSLVTICGENLGDQERAESYLQRLNEIGPTHESLTMQLQIVEANPARYAEKRPLLSRLLGLGSPPLCDRLIEVSKMVYEEGQRHWAWALLAALLGAAPVDAWTKAALTELKKPYERFDSLSLLNASVTASLSALPTPDAFQSALSDLCSRVFLQAEDASYASIDSRTGPGKVFERVAECLGLHGRVLRAQDSSQALGVLAPSSGISICVRSDVLSAPANELAYLFTYGLLVGRPECAALAAVPEEDRGRLVPALMIASHEAGGQDEDPAVAALATRLSCAMHENELRSWQESLMDLPTRVLQVQSLFTCIDGAAMRGALIAGGDLRTATRAIARTAPDNKRPPGVARLEDFEAFFASLPAIPPLLAFATSEDFGRILSNHD